MEAVRTLQTSLQPVPDDGMRAADARVSVHGDEVLIESLAVEDRTLVELIEHREGREIAAAETVVDALEIGARVLDREATGAEVDAIRRELERASAEAEHSFAERARRIGEDLEKQFERFVGEDGGAMSKVLDAHGDELTELIARHFGGDRNTAVQHQVKEIVAKSLSDSRQDLLRQFSAEDGHNPLADFKASVVREVKRSGESHEKLIEKIAQLEGEVKLLHDAAEAEAELAAEREQGHRQGPDVRAARFRAARGDGRGARRRRAPRGGRALRERRQEGRHRDRDRRRLGPARGRIAIDAKDERLSKNRAWETLNAALAERDAGFAILLVASDEKVPAGRQQLHEYEGNKMIVTLDKDDARRPRPRARVPLRAVPLPDVRRARPRAGRRRRARRRRGGSVGAEGRAEDPQLPHRRQQERRRRARHARLDGGRVENSSPASSR